MLTIKTTITAEQTVSIETPARSSAFNDVSHSQKVAGVEFNSIAPYSRIAIQVALGVYDLGSLRANHAFNLVDA